MFTIMYIDEYGICQKYLFLREMEDANLICNLNNNVQWLIPQNQHIIPTVRMRGNVLEIRNASLFHSGRYECHGESYKKYSWSERLVMYRALCYVKIISK